MNNVLVLKLGLAQSPFFFPQVLTSHSCSEEGLEDAANVLLQLSRGDPGTRDTVLKLLLNGARHLGYTLCKQIGNNNNKALCFSETFYLGVTCLWKPPGTPRLNHIHSTSVAQLPSMLLSQH